MAGDGALCGVIYLEGSTWAGPEDTEALAPVSLGISNGGGLGGAGVRGRANAGPRPSRRPRPSEVARARAAASVSSHRSLLPALEGMVRCVLVVGHSAIAGSARRRVGLDGEAEAPPASAGSRGAPQRRCFVGWPAGSQRSSLRTRTRGAALTGFCPSLSAGHGNHRENSPFLCPLEASRGNEYYDRNLALFEVAEEPFGAAGVVGRWAGRNLQGPAPSRGRQAAQLCLDVLAPPVASCVCHL